MKSRIRPVNTENRLLIARRKGDGGIDDMGEGEGEVQASSYGVGKSWGQSDDTVQVMCRDGDGQVHYTCSEHSTMDKGVKSLSCTPETNVRLYVN